MAGDALKSSTHRQFVAVVTYQL